MELRDFFETVTVSLEIVELFEEYRNKIDKKQALEKARFEVLENYEDELDMQTLAFMSSYWIGLQNGFVDKLSKSVLETLNMKDILEQFGEESCYIYEIIEQLLKEKLKKNNITNTNLGAYNWKCGDIYAYRITEAESVNKDLQGKYILIYCIENNIKTKKKSEVTAYLLMKRSKELSGSIDDIFNDSYFLPSVRRQNSYLYRNMFIDSNDVYPNQDSLIYLGNKFPIITPKDELVMDSIYNRRICWRWFADLVEIMISFK